LNSGAYFLNGLYGLVLHRLAPTGVKKAARPRGISIFL
jgi:hypothetical protein